MDLGESNPLCEDDDKSSVEIKKSCTDCKTTKTPLWRAGPAGPKSLCNACGIRYRKAKEDILGLQRSPSKRRKRSNIIIHSTTPCSTENSATATATATAGSSTSSGSCGDGNELRESLKMRLIVVGKAMLFQRSTVLRKQRCQRRRKPGDEEQQAAFSLMALSCGSVFA